MIKQGNRRWRRTAKFCHGVIAKGVLLITPPSASTSKFTKHFHHHYLFWIFISSFFWTNSPALGIFPSSLSWVSDFSLLLQGGPHPVQGIFLSSLSWISDLSLLLQECPHPAQLFASRDAHRKLTTMNPSSYLHLGPDWWPGPGSWASSNFTVLFFVIPHDCAVPLGSQCQMWLLICKFIKMKLKIQFSVIPDTVLGFSSHTWLVATLTGQHRHSPLSASQRGPSDSTGLCNGGRHLSLEGNALRILWENGLAW